MLSWKIGPKKVLEFMRQFKKRVPFGLRMAFLGLKLSDKEFYRWPYLFESRQIHLPTRSCVIVVSKFGVMNVLIDTNIFISREDYKQVPASLSSLLELFEKNSVKICIHPLSKQDIKRDPNLERMQISLSKMASYPELLTPPTSQDDLDFIGIVGDPKNKRDIVDNELLYAVYKDAANFLITNDKEIIEKAQKVGSADRVLSVEEALEFFSRQFVKYFSAPTPAIKHAPVYNLDLSDPIFGELRKEYPEFGDWWKKISREGRSAWVFEREDKKLGGILILNQENEPIDSIPPMSKRKRLKICTFNVTHRGQKLGELFLKVAFRHALKTI
jgi:predicted nucleic acid-binding protein